MGLTEFLAGYITKFIDATGYASVFILMTMESMVFPIPSEAVMPFAGFLISDGKFTFVLVTFWSTLGSIVGSMLSYFMGKYGGKPFVNKFGKYLLLDEEELAVTEKFFGKYGDATIFVSRFIPIVRHLISIPAGVGKMNLVKFGIYTVIGAGMWNTFLAWCGYVLKEHWDAVMKYSKVVDIVVLVILVGLVGLFIYRHVRKTKRT
ncbi:MAG: DedA family protein [Elusimicrobiota bacterium]